ncbi:hypothetical protein BJI67_12575 [Acidihalobacter aeolianus]|uniref:Dinitrogenase iron-molybdenum cofactor biosynthesis domain-containing protein n=1 Tax=Acidihalobacter aeolianus TaxID=2792603 RepID=A0A1D8KA03_9GAMM|nr:hypothetical protein [Acidihalobacter aeolianus]AOV17771.1 hypothetical protein BJI67_12575 [Acidihalobacter aeolianus]
MHAHYGEPAWTLCESGSLPGESDRAVVAVDDGEAFALYDCSQRGLSLIGRVGVPTGEADVLARRLSDCDLVLVDARRPDLHAHLVARGVPMRRLGRGERGAAVLAGWRRWCGEARRPLAAVRSA